MVNAVHCTARVFQHNSAGRLGSQLPGAMELRNSVLLLGVKPPAQGLQLLGGERATCMRGPGSQRGGKGGCPLTRRGGHPWRGAALAQFFIIIFLIFCLFI